jgi:putative transposase
VQVALHIVWTTRQRNPIVHGSIETTLYRCVVAEAEKAGAKVIAINGMPDHVHVLLLFPTSISIGHLVKQMKGVSSSLARDLWPQRYFAWAEGYGVFSVERQGIDRVATYIQNQKQHHASGKLWMLLEQPDAPEPSSHIPALGTADRNIGGTADMDVGG